MPYKLVPINQVGYFDTHLHSVAHGPKHMQQYSMNDLFTLIDRCAAAHLQLVCITDHIPFPNGVTDPSPNQDCTISIDQYSAVWQALATIQQYGARQQVTVIWGGEYDVFPNQSGYAGAVQWKVLGQHFIDTVADQPWCFDLSAETFATGVEQFGIHYVVDRYFALLQQAIHTGQFDSVAHLDLITKYNVGNQYFLEDAHYQQLVATTLQVIKQTNTALEINLGGCTATGHLVPQPWIIQQALQLDIPITIGSDEHAPNQLNPAIWDDVYAQLKRLGVTQLARPHI
ncbi:MAG: hypothetical protein HYV33_05660 [Candidatus Kerfeldbacteria bacterium]|nr:hypothetical protein [Candidatus Kerfeldbacteria bacterium]